MQQPVRSSVKQDEVQPRPERHLAFYLTGNRSREALNAIGELALRPALFARYRDLTALRYDFPLILAWAADGSAAVQSLSSLFDDLLSRCAHGEESGRVRQHALRLEREIRIRAARSPAGSLLDRWAEAARHACAPCSMLTAISSTAAPRRLPAYAGICGRQGMRPKRAGFARRSMH